MASHYNFAMYNSDEDERPNDNNLWAAVLYMAQLFESHEVFYAVMGGFSMKLRGSTRETTDIDIAVNISMRRLWDIITPQPRLVVPNTRLIEGTLRLFVKTGRKVGDSFCDENQKVVVDVAVKKPVEQNRELISFQFQGKQRTLYVLTIPYMMMLKLGAFAGRRAAKDFHDIVHFLHFYPDEVVKTKESLNRGDVSFLLNSSFFGQLDEDRKERYRALLTKNVEPEENAEAKIGSSS